LRVPDRLEPLLDVGIIDEVVRPLMSGKEAEVYLVWADGEECVAKVYKDAQFRSFQHRAEYIEGRRVRSSRGQRAMDKKSRHRRRETEDAWRTAEADAIQRLHASRVRVPEPLAFFEGVLVMELIRDHSGEPAPRLVDLAFSTSEATEVFQVVLREVVKMLCAGIVHADLSDFNVLMGVDGPVLIDFPQVVDPAHNGNARRLLLRDLKNLTGSLGRFAPKLRKTRYGPEMWDLYERSELQPDTPLTGRYQPRQKKADVHGMLEEILEMEREARERRKALGLPPPRPARRPIVREEPEEPRPRPKKRRRRKKPADASAKGAQAPTPVQQAALSTDAPKKRRRRRRKKPSGGSAAGADTPAPPQQAAVSTDAPKKRRRRRRRRKKTDAGC